MNILSASHRELDYSKSHKYGSSRSSQIAILWSSCQEIYQETLHRKACDLYQSTVNYFFYVTLISRCIISINETGNLLNREDENKI